MVKRVVHSIYTVRKIRFLYLSSNANIILQYRRIKQTRMRCISDTRERSSCSQIIIRYGVGARTFLSPAWNIVADLRVSPVQKDEGSSKG